MTLESSKTSIEFSNEKRYKYLITKFENSSDIIIRTLSDDEKVEIISNISVELICYYKPHSNVIEKGSCKDAYEEPEVGQKPPPEVGLIGVAY